MDMLLHDQTRSQLDAISAGRAGSYIFHGPRSVGKATAARLLAQRLNCHGDNGQACASCRLFEAGNYPDHIVVQPEDKPSITIEQIRGLIQALNLSPYYAGGTRVVVIDRADLMTVEAQNSLLKLIEEPPSQTVFILVSEQVSSLLPTVRSRCGQVYFPRLANDQIASHLTAAHGVATAQAADLAEVADGALGLAVNLAAKPEDAKARLDLSRLAVAVPAQSRFDRLLLAAKLTAGGGADLPYFASLLHRQAIEQLQEGHIMPNEARRRLDALEVFRRQLQARVSSRAALESLMVVF